MIYFHMSSSKKFNVFGLSKSKIYGKKHTLIDASNFDNIEKYIQKLKPKIIINCIGLLINQSNENLRKAIKINTLFPHFLDRLSFKYCYKLIHISTDCVFSGNKGDSYFENDFKDGIGNYSITKGLGEVINDRNLTLRTSVVGPELTNRNEELFNWFMSQTNDIDGFTNVYWSGVSTSELAKNVSWAIENNLKGLYHVTNGTKISKNDLLKLFKKYSKKKITIRPTLSSFSDKTLINSRKEFSCKVPSYDLMIKNIFIHLNNNKHLYPHYNL